jgi:hypothetical protein
MRRLVPVVTLAVTCVLLLIPLPRGWHGGWRGELLDAGHVPLFAAVAVSLWVWLRPALVRPVLIAVAVAGLAEVVQHFVGRTASWFDFLHGSLGALAAGACIRAWRDRRSPRRALGWFVLAVGLLTWPVVRFSPVLLDAVEGWGDFPTLAGFRTEREMMRWETHQAELTREADPQRPDGWSAQLTFQPGPEPYPGATLSPVVRDLSNYRWLCCSFAVDGAPLELVISIRGGPDVSGQTTHYQTERVYEPGEHVARVDLPAVAPLARPRPLDLSGTWFVQLFVDNPPAPRSIRLHRVWVEN